MNGDVNRLLLMADIVLYGSSQDVQGFPPLLTRAMSFGIPVIAPDYPVIKKYVSSVAFCYGVSFFIQGYLTCLLQLLMNYTKISGC